LYFVFDELMNLISIWLYYVFDELKRKKLYFVVDELMEKIYREKNNSMKYIRKNRLKYLNQTDEFDSDSFLLNTKNRTNQAFIDSDIGFTQNQSKLIQLHSYAHYKPTINSQSP
jgi:hypothetical protein